nr:hypothetical protein [Pseudomonas aeruginosa]EIU2864248.1 hypothetical protein [Pseudomonas aeruginosa]
MQAKMPFTCLFKDQSVEVRTSVIAVDVRDAITRFFTSDVGMPRAHANQISVDLLQEVPANYETHYTLAGEGWVVRVSANADPAAKTSASQLGDVYVPEGPVRNTILAALRFYQEQGMGDPIVRSDAIHDIATGGGDETSLDEWGIEELCQSINFAECPAAPLVIVRCTADDDILVEADQPVKLVHLTDNQTADDGDDLVVLDGIEMWKQEFDVVPSDLADIVPYLNLKAADSPAGPLSGSQK